MLTLFACPKPFRGHIAVIQRNAIRSWTLLHPQPEIILFGDEEGTAEFATELGVRHVPQVARNECGTPMLDGLFGAARDLAAFDLLAFVNADIILGHRFANSVALLQQRGKNFVMFCSPWNVRIDTVRDFGSQLWEEELWDLVRAQGRPPKRMGVDVFLFRKHFYGRIPPVSIGRLASDNWLIYHACLNAPLAVDASPYVRAIHQEHADSTHSAAIKMTEEMKKNVHQVGWWACSFVARDLPFELQENGKLRKKSVGERLQARASALYASNFIIGMLQRTYSFRRKIGLYRTRPSQPPT